MFTPSVVAMVHYSLNKDGVVITDAANTLSIRDTEGVVYTFEKGKSADDDTMLDIFAQMRDSAQKGLTLPDSVATSASFTVTYSIADRETRYEYYLSKGSENAFFLDSAGTVYKIDPAAAELFLATSYAQSIYNESKVPTLTLSGEYTVRPDKAQWMYKNTTGNFVASDTAALVDQNVENYDVEGGFSLALSSEPDSFNVKVTDKNGEVLFDDSHANIGSLRLDEGTKITVEAEAKWYEDDERTYYGEISYKFSTVVSAAAEFYPGITSAEAGEFFSLTAVNVKDPAKISFTSEPSIDYTPVFVEDEQDPQYVRALVPLKTTLTPGAYTFTLTYAGTTQTIGFEVKKRTINAREYNIDAATAKAFLTDSAISAFNTETAAAASSVTGKKQWDGYFLQGEDYDSISYGFGHVRTVSSVDKSYNHPGVDYSAAAGADVAAVNSGTVVFAGVLELTGYTVIIDHGFGLKTWYWHMSENTVKEGDFVERGDTIGKTGKTGFTSQNGVHLGMSVCDVFVCPYSTWVDGDWKDVPLYTK